VTSVAADLAISLLLAVQGARTPARWYEGALGAAESRPGRRPGGRAVSFFLPGVALMSR
jgi:hypothetical protein